MLTIFTQNLHYVCQQSMWSPILLYMHYYTVDSENCPVCHQALPGIVDLAHRTPENMLFREYQFTQRLILA
jgi:hypothetical protein